MWLARAGALLTSADAIDAVRALWAGEGAPKIPNGYAPASVGRRGRSRSRDEVAISGSTGRVYLRSAAQVTPSARLRGIEARARASRGR